MSSVPKGKQMQSSFAHPYFLKTRPQGSFASGKCAIRTVCAGRVYDGEVWDALLRVSSQPEVSAVNGATVTRPKDPTMVSMISEETYL